MAVVGKNILDNLTTGMYSDSKIIFREYIQNACDQIDVAISENLLSKEDASIDIFINPDDRFITIRDNATGVPENKFKAMLGNIADSDKKISKNKGFRGIGRLCGLAYCKTLTFRTSYRGENKTSIMICDAEKMRAMLAEDKKYSLDNVWDTIISFTTEQCEEEEHFFEVELKDINKEDTELLNEDKVKTYLSFVAPVPYRATFYFKELIYKHASDIKFSIDEYKITVNGAQVLKEYRSTLKELSSSVPKTYDEIQNLEFHNFYNDNNELVAWMWYGLSKFDKQIPKCNLMRGLRLRCGNIQIGNDNTLEKLFKESRGNYYYVGEVFAVDKKLIPNSQRDYFNQNENRKTFEQLLQSYFFTTLHSIYTIANKIKNDYKRMDEYNKKIEEYNSKKKEGFIDNKDRDSHKMAIEKAKIEAEKAQKELSRITDKLEHSSPVLRVKQNIEEGINALQLQREPQNHTEQINVDAPVTYVTKKMNLSKKEQKLVGKILSIISENAPQNISENIITKIKEALM